MHLKARYRRPQLVEYGRIEDLTLGQTGTSPDQIIVGGQLITINTICDPNQPHPGLICS